jgi:cytochrome c5
MKPPSAGWIAGGVIGVAAVALVSIGTPDTRKPHAGVAATSPAAPPTSVTANGFTLASTSVDLPTDEATYPAGPHADVVNANCTACHSASMALTQPVLTADQWKATVTKMREVYKAPVAEQDVSAIVAYLTAMPSQQRGTHP